MNKCEILKNYFGHTTFRRGQEEVIDSILSGRDVIGIMPTGAGKSICYQLPALMLNGVTIVVSPLISLMKDQVNALLQSGINCAFINSSLSYEEYQMTLNNTYYGAYKILYVAPERLVTDTFINLAQRIPISMVVVDEAHCVSHWGQDFRPSYLKINEFMSKLSYRPIVSAFTATATNEVKIDIVRILNLNNPFEIITGFNRENLYFEIRKPADKTGELIKILKGQNENSVIVYCIARKTVESVCSELNEAGFSAVRYHAGLSTEERRHNQDEFIYDRAKIMVATNAFGMGIDKSNVSMVIHYNMPKNIESYYQEAGRAGRDGEPAQCILFYSGADVRTNLFLIEQNNENENLSPEIKEQIKQRDRERLKQMTFYCTTKNCLRQFILNYFGEKSSNCCENCSNCNANFESVDVSIQTQKILSCVYRMKQSYGINMVSDVLRGSKSARVTDLHFDKLSTYGIMQESSAKEIREIIDYLLDSQYLFLTDTQYPYLKLTSKSREILIERKPIYMKRLKNESRIDEYGKSSKTKIYSIDMVLFDRLRRLRNAIATQQNVPSYTIFTDASLRDMCIVLPKTTAEFLNVSGVGRNKTDKYGELFLKEIRLFLANNSNTEIKSTDLGNKSVLEHICQYKNKILPLAETVSLSVFVERILMATGIVKQNKIVFNAIVDWLIDMKILTHIKTDKGRNILRVTENAKQYEIIQEDKISKFGTHYIAVLYTPTAQQFIIDNLDKIAGQ